jgi:hypothetical protein
LAAVIISLASLEIIKLVTLSSYTYTATPTVKFMKHIPPFTYIKKRKKYVEK